MAGTKRVKAAAAAPKRKAAEDASPIAVKKVKAVKANGTKDETPTKPTKKSKKVEEVEEVIASEEVDDEEHPFSDDEENAEDEAQALAKTIDNDEEDEAEVDEAVAFKKGQDVGKAPKPKKSKAITASSEEPGVVYVGRLPHGFYEHELRGYFSQFGPINKLRLSRSKKTGASKHFAFVEFAEASTAEIVAKTMDKYLLFGHILICKVVPQSQVHESLWKGSNKRFKKIPWNKMAGAQLKKPRTESGWTGKIEREELRRITRSKKLKAIGYEFEEPKLKAVEDAHMSEAPAIEEAEKPKAIEAAPAVQVPEVSAEVEKSAPKAGKKGKGKGKKVKA